MPWSSKQSFSFGPSHQKPVHVSPLSHTSQMSCPPQPLQPQKINFAGTCRTFISSSEKSPFIHFYSVALESLTKSPVRRNVTVDVLTVSSQVVCTFLTQTYEL
jgi:hypothetical protein